MLDEVAQRLEESEQRIDRLIRKINELESAGRWSDAQPARETLAVIHGNAGRPAASAGSCRRSSGD